MTIRTISQLPTVLDTQNVSKGAFFEISSPKDNGMYKSEKCSYAKVESQISSVVSNGVADEYGLKHGTTKYNVKDIASRVTSLETGDMEIGGRKIFSTIPAIAETNVEAYHGFGGVSTAQLVPNIGKVIDLVDNRAGFISQQDIVDANLVRSNHSTIESPKFLYWHFDDQGRDSSEWIDPATTLARGPTVVNKTGWLTMTGWLADNGNVLLQDAWVGLFGYINVRSEDDSSTISHKWVPLQYQPWPLGSSSAQRQYVTFSLPVRKGLMLKIKTGFKVNGYSSGFQSSNSIQLPLNEPNTFVGYIIYNADT